MPWLVRGDQVLSSLRVADSSSARIRGLVGRDGLEGAILLRPARSVHTLDMRLPIDVAHLDYDLTVLRTTRMPILRRWPVRWPCLAVPLALPPIHRTWSPLDAPGRAAMLQRAASSGLDGLAGFKPKADQMLSCIPLGALELR